MSGVSWMDGRAGGAYAGDEALGRLLAESGSPYDVAGLRALLAGVLAAPPAFDRAAWTRLVAENPAPALVEQLLPLHDFEARRREAAAPDRGARLEALRRELARRGIH